jgi:glyoxylase-like metal-dependent hydrolase (beta-lactamase superfamily II)
MPRRICQFLLLALLSFALPATAAPLQPKPQVPGYYRIMVGDVQVTALYDGDVAIRASTFKQMPQEKVRALFAANFFDADKGAPTAVNAYLIDTGSLHILIDAGFGRCLGPTAGHQLDALRAAGYAPEDIDTVLITHLHRDHICGLTTPDGRATFPKATLWVAEEEAAYWLSPTVAATQPQRHTIFETAHAALAPYQAAGTFRTFSADKEIVPGLVAHAAHGHTPGHTAFLLTSGKDQLLIWGDIVLSSAIQFAHPETTYQLDSDPAQAAATRQTIFAAAVANGWRIAGTHLPFPGIGRMRTDGTGYAWVPVEYDLQP